MSPEPGPSLVLVVLDTARVDHVGVADGSAFAQLARRGRRFHRAVAPAPWTLPSHASLFSGLPPSEHRVTGDAVIGRDGRPRSPRALVERLADRWLPEILRRKGYATFAATGNPWVGPGTGLTLGFDQVVEAWRHAPLPKLSDPLHTSAGGSVRRLGRAAVIHARRVLGSGDGGAALSLDAFARFLRARDGAPFAAFFNVMEPHAPYIPPRRYVDAARRLAGLRAVRRWGADRMLRYGLGREEIAPAELELLRELYAGECAYADAWLARLLELLGARLDGTVVVVTSDHGENLGERHLLSHVLSMHETVLRVPLAIAGPGVPAGEEPRPVGLAALPRAVLSLTEGRWEDPVANGCVAEYESAASQVSGARRIEDQVGEVAPADLARLRARWVAVYEGRFKLTATSDGAERLVDLDADPDEERDVGGDHADVVERLRSRVRFAGPAPALGERLEGEIASHLEGLGYL